MNISLSFYDFFQDGRSDVLSEIRLLQHCGLWTPRKRAIWTKQAVATHCRLRYTPPRRSAGNAYYAGRVSALKSSLSAYYPEARQESEGNMLIEVRAEPEMLFCRGCGSRAVWKFRPDADSNFMMYLCDCCCSERIRSQTTSITSNVRDMDEDEALCALSDLDTRKVGKVPPLIDIALVLCVVFPFYMLVQIFLISLVFWLATHTYVYEASISA